MTTHTARMKAFAGEAVKTHRYIIIGERVQVWDAVASHYTPCHALSGRTERRLIRAARMPGRRLTGP